MAAKVGGDQSFGRATQVVRVAGSVHAKNGKPSLRKIVYQTPAEYSLDDIPEAIENLRDWLRKLTIVKAMLQIRL